MVDLFLTDPPYNVNYHGTAGTIKNDKMKNNEYIEFLTSAFINAAEYMKAGASFYIWYGNKQSHNFIPAVNNVFNVRQYLIWNKSSFTLGRSDYHWKHEACVYGWKEGAPHKWYSDRKQTTVLDFKKPLRNKLHPTMKPVELMAYLIGNSTKENDKVLDLFGGSGSTLIACEELNRQCYMLELEPHYCAVIINRWEALTGGKAVLLSDTSI